MNITRLAHGPIIRPHMDERMGDNVNGPSLIEAPAWLGAPLGRYYLYFAHHDGDYIRMAYADHLEGPWQIYSPGVMDLSASGFAGHIASPDVHVDPDNQEIRMYFHGCEARTEEGGPQFTRLALSTDGLNFRVTTDNLGPAYLRAFRYRDSWYGVAMPGRTFCSTDGKSNFHEGPGVLPKRARHSAVAIRGNKLRIVFTTVGDNPEHLQYTELDLSAPWDVWSTTRPTSILRPLRDYEGADCPAESSTYGIAKSRVRQLRDPALYVEDGKTYLLYVVAGESGIALARISD